MLKYCTEKGGTMIKRIDHVSIAVKDYEKAKKFFMGVLGVIPGSQASDDSMKFKWLISSAGDLSRLEIISPTGEGSFLEGFLKDREGGVHHITFQTPDLQKAKAVLDTAGIPYFGENEYPGGVWKEIFIHPKDAFGVLLQIAEFTPDDWLAPEVCMPRSEKFEVEETLDGCSIRFAHPGGGTVRLELTDDEARFLIEKMKRSIS
jgi:methylmalonyl-CoA/ethylmalonyl-CoA epimerase